MTIPDSLPDDPSPPDNEEQEREPHLAGALARAFEDAGLVARTDHFSWEFHMMFDAEIEAASHEVPDLNPSPSPDSSAVGSEAGVGLGDGFVLGSFLCGDFGTF